MNCAEIVTFEDGTVVEQVKEAVYLGGLLARKLKGLRKLAAGSVKSQEQRQN